MVTRLFLYISGLAILSFGIDLMILSNLGTGAWDALNVALQEHFGLSIGNWAIIVGVILIVIIVMIKPPKTKKDIISQIVLPFVTMTIIGNLIDFHFLWLDLQISSWGIGILTVFIGTIIMSLGIAMYLQADFGYVPIDGLVMVVYEKTGWTLRVAKTSIEMLALLIAFILGGPIGIGTVVVTIAIGPLLQIFYQSINRIIKVN